MNLDLRGIPVSFPYKAYPVQVEYMSKVIESLQSGSNALLESPTGTGKTLSLLCSTLSWRRTQNPAPKVIYSSRTHDQLANVVSELKKTSFRPRVAHIASRNHLCPNDGMKGLDSANQARQCRLLRMSKRCPFGDDERIKASTASLLNATLSLEDFREACRSQGSCPYFVSQNLIHDADLVLTPYAYLVDPRSRVSIPSDLITGSVLIFDEAHNLPESCCNNYSIDVPFQYFQDVGDFFQSLLYDPQADFRNRNSPFDPGIATVYRGYFIRCYKALFSSNLCPHGSQFVEKPHSFVRRFLESFFKAADVGAILAVLQYFKEDAALPPFMSDPIEMIERLFVLVYKTNELDSFGFCFTPNAIHANCFTSAKALESILLLQPRCLVLTSGTISPIGSFAESLGCPFPVVLEGGHIAKPSQLFLGVCKAGMSEDFAFTRANRGSQGMREDLKRCLEGASQAIPHGLLVFFPSFSFLAEFDGFQLSTKRVIVEPRDPSLSRQSVLRFKEEAKEGTALLAVCRGKLSEGIDFKDDFARGVCVVGVPFPNLGDFKVAFRRAWMNSAKAGSGDRWYVEAAMRTVNQSIGRAIRHKDDYAAVVLFDRRYVQFRGMLSKWLQPSVEVFESFDAIPSRLEAFFCGKSTLRRAPVRVRTYDDFVTSSQDDVLTPRMPSERRAAVAMLEFTLGKAGFDEFLGLLKRFKAKKDILYLKEAMGLVKNEECRRRFASTLSSKLLKAVEGDGV